MGLVILGSQKYPAQPLVPEPSAFKVQLVLKKLKDHKSLGIDQIPTELIKTEGRTSCYEIHKLINCLMSGRSQSLYLSIRRVIKQAVLIIKSCHLCQLCTKFYRTSCCQG